MILYFLELTIIIIIYYFSHIFYLKCINGVSLLSQLSACMEHIRSHNMYSYYTKKSCQ